MIIGLTGSMGCGKGEIVNILRELGFEYITLSSMVREEARRRGVPDERSELMKVGNSMRTKGGAGVLARLALQKVEKSGRDKWVIDGIRNPAEIDELRKGKDVYIVGVKVGRDLLVERILGRGREGDAGTRDEIIAKIEREFGVGEPPDGQRVGECMKKVDKVIENEGTLEELKEKFVAYYDSIR